MGRAIRKPAKINQILLAIVTSLLLFSCATTTEEPNRFGHFHDFPYVAPEYVSQADEVECAHEANGLAWNSIDKVNDTTAFIFGPLGAMFMFGSPFSPPSGAHIPPVRVSKYTWITSR